MAATTQEIYTFQESSQQIAPLHFELRSLQLDQHCVIHENNVSDNYKIYFIEEGTGTYEVDFTEFNIEGAGIFCLSPGQIFNVKSESIKRAYQISFDKDFYCVETHGKEIACNGLLFNNVHRASVISLNPNQLTIFKSLIDQLIIEFKNKGAAHREMLESYLRMFLVQALRLVEQQEVSASSTIKTEDRLVQDFIALVDKNYKNEHAVSGYAEKLFVAPKTLAKRLNAHRYPTPLQVIKDRIIIEAKRQLRYSKKSIKEIAFELGFDDPGYFSRLFSKATSTSPLEYRKN